MSKTWRPWRVSGCAITSDTCSLQKHSLWDLFLLLGGNCRWGVNLDTTYCEAFCCYTVEPEWCVHGCLPGCYVAVMQSRWKAHPLLPFIVFPFDCHIPLSHSFELYCTFNEMMEQVLQYAEGIKVCCASIFYMVENEPCLQVCWLPWHVTPSIGQLSSAYHYDRHLQLVAIWLWMHREAWRTNSYQSQ